MRNTETPQDSLLKLFSFGSNWMFDRYLFSPDTRFIDSTNEMIRTYFDFMA